MQQVLIVLYVAGLICFWKFNNKMDIILYLENQVVKLKKSTLKSDFTPNFQHWAFIDLKSQQSEIWQY